MPAHSQHDLRGNEAHYESWFRPADTSAGLSIVDTPERHREAYDPDASCP